ncbi:hypothetical protein PRIPAC_81913 [Pristionchus pacificus]|uniref:Uncharacterized protein n=1 Tax=Pristionchus pacificus TaxID=54126 RepID=A0A2A6CBK6_PRIPA|nr:hypothetical protein PRIPAC_81913 [Pristionchus pacificus]|eukprot:PDM75519.1 hypothetical protein PRIPAC_42696 [Pristionchus pacificus]
MEKEIDEDWNYITKKKKKSTISNLISFIKRIIWHKQKHGTLRVNLKCTQRATATHVKRDAPLADSAPFHFHRFSHNTSFIA